MDKQRSLTEIEEYVDALIGLCRDKKVLVLDDYYVVRMLFLLERILSFGLAKGFFSPFTLWEVFEGLKDSLPDGAKIIAPVKNKQQTDLGRARLFLRIALNDGCLHEYLSALLWNRKQLGGKYEKTALVVREDFSMPLLDSIAKLEKNAKFRVSTASAKLDQPNLWQQVDWSQLLMESNLGKSIEVIEDAAVVSVPPDDLSAPPVASIPVAVSLPSPPAVVVADPVVSVAKVEEVVEEPKTPIAIVMDVKLSSREADVIGRLQAAGKSCLLESGTENKNVLYARSNSVLDLLVAIECVMKDGLTVKFWEPENVWSCVKHLKNIHSESIAILDKVEKCDLVVTDVGRFRCFLLFGLEAKSCAKWIQMLHDSSFCAVYYPSRNCLFRSVDVVSVLVSVLETVESLRLLFEPNKGLDFEDLLVAKTSEKPVQEKTILAFSTSISTPDQVQGKVRKIRKQKKKKAAAVVLDSPAEQKQPNQHDDDLEILQEEIMQQQQQQNHQHQRSMEQTELKAAEFSESVSPPPSASVPVVTAAVSKSPETPFRILMEEEDSLDARFSTPKRLDLRHDSEKEEEEEEEVAAPNRVDDEMQDLFMLGAVASTSATSSAANSEIEQRALPIEEDEEEEEGWASDISKALSLIEDATHGLEEMIPPTPEKEEEPRKKLSQSLIVSSSDLNSSSERLTRSMFVPQASSWDEFQMPSEWVKESGPVPTFVRPVVRIATAIPDLTSLIQSEDYATTEKDIVVSNTTRKMNPVRLEPSGLVVTVKGEKQKIKKKEDVGSGKKLKKKTSASSVSPVRARTMSLESENEVFRDIRTTPQKKSQQSSILDLKTLALTTEMADRIANTYCPGCNRKLELRNRLFCHYESAWFCNRVTCHNGEKNIIPANLVLLWDFKQYSVSVKANLHIEECKSLPCINVALLNPGLYSSVSELNKVRLLRKQLSALGSVIQECTKAPVLMSQCGERIHLIQRALLHCFSVNDLMDVKSKVLLNFLTGLISSFSSHVMIQCAFCKSKGVKCPVCQNSKLLFSFQLAEVSTCPHCKSVYHRKCFEKLGDADCPKCLKMQEAFNKK